MTDFQRIKKLFRTDSVSGFSESEIHDLLEKVGRLPQVLLDYYKELGNSYFNYTQNYLIKPNEYSKYANDKYIIICIENQACACWGIRKEDISKENPPVFCSDDMLNWDLECIDLYNFLHGFMYINAIFSLDYGGENCIEVAENDINYIRNNFKNKNVRFNAWSYGIEFYGDYDDTIISIIGESFLYYASNNEEHYIEMENKMRKIEVK